MNPTSKTPTNRTPHSPKASVGNPSNSENPFSNSCDYTQVANVSPLPILKGRVTTMDKLKVKVKNLYPQAHACMHASHRFTCLCHTPRQQKDSFLHSEYMDPCLAPNPWKTHNFVNLQMSFLLLEFPEMYITSVLAITSMPTVYMQLTMSGNQLKDLITNTPGVLIQ